MTETLPKQALDIVQGYLALPLGGKNVPVPYVTNHDHIVFFGLRVFMGKGSPEEIREEAESIARQHSVDFSQLLTGQIRAFLKLHHLGVDCSGLISHIWFSMYGERVFQVRGLTIGERLLMKWRPFENVSVARLKRLCAPQVLREVRPSDIIVTRGEHHALLVTQVTKDDEEIVKLDYIHSTSFFQESGVRTGEIVIIDPQKELVEQAWQEGAHERNWTWEGYLVGKEKNGIYRFKKSKEP